MKNIKRLCVLVVMSVFAFTGCFKPPEVADISEVKPNETAWLIPLDGSSKDGQVKFNSVSFLNEKKIPAKRVSIGKVWRHTGYSWQWWAGEWIPVARLITVDRSLVTRELTDNEQTGTDKKADGIPVNTKDNIKLVVGLTMTLSIEEEDASTYLYYHGQRLLSEVADQNVRSYAVAELNRLVSAMTLSAFQDGQTDLYATLFRDTTAFFKQKGITVNYLGNAEGWHFRDKNIQDSINASFIAQQDNKTAIMEQAAIKTRNATLVLNATAQKDAAEALFAAQKAAEFQTDLKVTMMNAETRLAMANKWDGKLPANILPEGSSLIMDFGAKK